MDQSAPTFAVQRSGVALPDLAIDATWRLRPWALRVAQHRVITEMGHALQKHGKPTTDPMRGVATLTEELGEVAKEALDSTRLRDSPTSKFEALVRMYGELAQLAGYATLLMMSIDSILPDSAIKDMAKTKHPDEDAGVEDTK